MKMVTVVQGERPDSHCALSALLANLALSLYLPTPERSFFTSTSLPQPMAMRNKGYQPGLPMHNLLVFPIPPSLSPGPPVQPCTAW